jgi:predicted acylesterase/phospholipase RssA
VPAPQLQQLPADLSEGRVGISYSGGGPLVLIELGIAQAFVDLKIVPAAIAGVSAGAIAGTAHALDPVNGAGIKAAAEALLMLSNMKLGLTRGQMVLKVLAALLSFRRLPDSLADNGSVKQTAEVVFQKLGCQPGLTVGDFGKNGRVPLFVGGTDAEAGERTWFGDQVQAADALIASSAIPGVFPPRTITIDGKRMVFVDGAVAQNQPLSELVLTARCGTLYACAVGYDGEPQAAPRDALENVLKSISIVSHESSRLEQGYVQLMFQQAGKGVAHHIHPEGPFDIKDFNFTQAQIDLVMSRACEQTKTYIQDGRMPPSVPVPSPAPALATVAAPPP